MTVPDDVANAQSDQQRSTFPTTAPIPGEQTRTAAPQSTATTATSRTAANGGGWLSGASGDGATDGTLGTWRGTPVQIVGTWADQGDNQTELWPLQPGGSGDFDGPLDVAPGGLQAGDTWAAAASGAYDGRWTQSLTKLAQLRAGKGTTWIRPFHEMNLAGWDWSVQPGQEGDFIAAWRRYRTIQQRVFPAAKLTFGVNVTSSGTDLDWRKIWPGAGQADALGVDTYNGWPTITSSVDFDAQLDATGAEGIPVGLNAFAAQAAAWGVPLAVPEWSGRAEMGDEPAFVSGMHDWFAAHAGTGPGQLVYEILFNAPQDGNNFTLYGDTRMPASADTYQQDFADAGGAATVTAQPLPTAAATTATASPSPTAATATAAGRSTPAASAAPAGAASTPGDPTEGDAQPHATQVPQVDGETSGSRGASQPARRRASSPTAGQAVSASPTGALADATAAGTAAGTTAGTAPAGVLPAATAATATSASSSVTPPTTSAADDSSTAPTGDLPGWRHVFSDDFTTPAPTGTFQTIYGQRWSAYDGVPDTSGNGTYSTDAISVHDGVMDLHIGNINGKVTSAAPVPLLNGDTGAWGQTYGRYSVRFKADPLVGMHMAWLLWPDDDSGPDKGWNQGEIDFPEADLDDTVSAFNHCPGDPTQNCLAENTDVSIASAWHTATTEWSPDGVTFILDGTVLGTSQQPPTSPMHWVLQTETELGRIPTTDGHVLVDWVSVWAHE